jgi:hypothetical protein
MDVKQPGAPASVAFISRLPTRQPELKNIIKSTIKKWQPTILAQYEPSGYLFSKFSTISIVVRHAMKIMV